MSKTNKSCENCRYKSDCILYGYLSTRNWNFQLRIIFGDRHIDGGAKYYRIAEICQIFYPWPHKT